MIVTLLLCIAALFYVTQCYQRDDRASVIPLKDIQTLTLYRDRLTTGKRGSPVPQLNRIGGNAKSHTIDVIQCYNQGFDGKSYQWKCDAMLDRSLKLGRIEVSCEGYDHSNDPYVLVGSCGLEYTLEEVVEDVRPSPKVTTTTTTTQTDESKRVPRYLPVSHSHLGPTTKESGLTLGVILACLLIFVFVTVAGIVLGGDCYYTPVDTMIARTYRASSSSSSSYSSSGGGETYRYKDRGDLHKHLTTLCTPTLVVNTVEELGNKGSYPKKYNLSSNKKGLSSNKRQLSPDKRLIL